MFTDIYAYDLRDTVVMMEGLQKKETQEERPCESDIVNAEVLWNYLRMRHTLEKSDAIIVFGNCDVRTAEWGSHLFLQGWAPWLVLAGSRGTSTPESWTTEADVFKEIALKMGVDESRIITERESRNTGENVALSYAAMRGKGIDPRKVIIVQMPFMERRVYATALKQWPGNVDDVTVIVTSPTIEFIKDYPTQDVGSLCEVIAKMAGCLQRVMEYPSLGFHIAQDIPDDVINSYRQLTSKEKYCNYLF